MATYIKRDATVTNQVSRGFTAGSPNDTYTTQRYFTSFDLSAVSSPATVNGPTADGSIIETHTVSSGDPYTPA